MTHLSEAKFPASTAARDTFDLFNAGVSKPAIYLQPHPPTTIHAIRWDEPEHGRIMTLSADEADTVHLEFTAR